MNSSELFNFCASVFSFPHLENKDIIIATLNRVFIEEVNTWKSACHIKIAM